MGRFFPGGVRFAGRDAVNMRLRLTHLIAAALALATLTGSGCDRKEKSADDGVPATVTGDARADKGVSIGGNGNAGTTAGAGATNGVSGNETDNVIGGVGNTPSGRGIETRPTTHSAGATGQ